MAYDLVELEKLALDAIEKHKLTKQNQLICYLPCVESTFYKDDLHKSELIKSALEFNKISKKKKLTDKWEESDNATLQIAAYKLMADDDELTRLNSQKIEAEHTLKGSGIKIGFADENDG